jgi:hypothetical protein
MTSLAAELTDRVIPFVPVRQFVLSLPHRQRYRLAYDHSRSIAVLRIFIRTVMSFYRRRGLKRGVRNGRTGSVTFLQRFGSAANCNLHFHVVMLDGVFAEDAHGELFFHAAEPPTEAELAKLIDSVRTRVLRHLARQGDWDGDHRDPRSALGRGPGIGELLCRLDRWPTDVGSAQRGEAAAHRRRSRCTVGQRKQTASSAARRLRPARCARCLSATQ